MAAGPINNAVPRIAPTVIDDSAPGSRITRGWFDVPDELLTRITDALGAPDMEVLMPAEALALAMHAAEGCVIDLPKLR